MRCIQLGIHDACSGKLDESTKVLSFTCKDKKCFQNIGCYKCFKLEIEENDIKVFVDEDSAECIKGGTINYV